MISLFNTIAIIFIATGIAGLMALVIYLWLFALTYVFGRKQGSTAEIEPQSRFVFVVPAHNEENGITATVLNLLSVDYPRTLFDVVVMADNCTDATAERAKTAGAECIKRYDAEQRGKGYALRYAFAQLLSKEYDAFIVIDADSIVSVNFLSVLNSRLSRGEKVVQAYDGLSNPDASILTYLFQVGSLIENKLFWEPKQKFGLPIMLRGNGMCFAREILEKHSWNAFSIVEDTEYGMLLTNNGIRIHFAPDTGVYACQPETIQRAFAQRVRWASGNSNLTKGRALNLIVTGVNRRNLALADLGLSLITGSKPLLLVANITFIFLSYLIGSQLLFCWASSLLLAQVLYIGLGIVLNGVTMQKMARLFLSPFYLAWLCMVSLLGVAGFRKNKWVRTARS